MKSKSEVVEVPRVAVFFLFLPSYFFRERIVWLFSIFRVHSRIIRGYHNGKVYAYPSHSAVKVDTFGGVQSFFAYILYYWISRVCVCVCIWLTIAHYYKFIEVCSRIIIFTRHILVSD